MLVSGLHDMIEKGLVHPPEYVLSAMRNFTSVPEGSPEQKKGFEKLIRAVTKVLYRPRSLLPPLLATLPGRLHTVSKSEPECDWVGAVAKKFGVV
eukprot:15403-Rhodomonas_salina.3